MSHVDRRRFLTYSGACATGVGLSGCQSLGDTGGAATTFEDGPIRIGAIVPEPDGLGETVLKCARLGIDAVNADGGIGGASVELVVGDSSGGPAAARQAYERLTTEEHVDVTVGGYFVDSLMPSIAEQETIHVTTMSESVLPAELVSRQVSPRGGDPEAEYERFKYHFRAGPMNVVELLEAFVEFIDLYHDRLGWDRISLLFENYTGNLDDRLEGVKADLETVGVTVPVAQITTSGIDDWSPIFDELEAAETDLAAIVSVLTGIPIVRQWADQERNFEMGGAHIFAMFPWFWEETGGAAEGLFTGNAITPQSRNTAHTEVFWERYHDEYGEDAAPMFAGPITYDTIRMLKDAYEDVGTLEADPVITYLEEDLHWQRGSIVPDFGFRGPDERFAHDLIWDCMVDCEGEFDNGSPHGPTGVPVWQQWQRGPDGDGVMEVFAPDRHQSAEYVDPPWMR
jgi:branched-chain amino acid transport system substrate-binding protein